MIINGRGTKKRKNIFLTFIIYYKLYLYLFTSSLYQYPESIFTSSLFYAVFLLHFMHCFDCFYFYYEIVDNKHNGLDYSENGQVLVYVFVQQLRV